MRGLYKHSILLVAASLILAACHVHELPVGSSDVAVTLHLQFDRTLDIYKTIEYPPVKAGEGVSGLTAHYCLRLYRGVAGDFEKEPCLEKTYSSQDITSPERDITLSLKPGRYLAQLWVDFRPGDSRAYYELSSFQDIRFAGEYAGGVDGRDAFYVQQELPLESLISAGLEYETTLTLSRPFAQYRFMASDKEEFLAFWGRESAIRHGSAVKSVFEAAELNDFKVRVVYPQYLPNSFNIFTDHPADAGTGYAFWTKMSLRDDGDVDLAWDWVLTGPEEGLVLVSLEFYDPSGEYISTFRNFEVPLKRGRVTLVRGNILTHGVDSGIAIDPTFDGEYNVQF